MTERIRAGELGEVYLLRTSLRDMRAPDPAFLASSGGFFVDVTIHDLDTARWMVGEVVDVTAIGAARSDPGSSRSATSTPPWSRCGSRPARSA